MDYVFPQIVKYLYLIPKNIFDWLFIDEPIRIFIEQ